MINVNNFKDVLEFLGFTTSDGNKYSREYNHREISVDFEEGELNYPECSKENKENPDGIIIHEYTTTDFSHNENFVVFECVCRLLEKGYRAEHIELEPRWTLGHGASGGRADILIRDENGDSYIIIECKTAGKEYKKAKEKAEEDGGQLFSYWQQVTSTKWLALYASDWDGNNVIHTSDVIHSEDDDNIIKLAEKDEDVLTYKKAHNIEERHQVWVSTYNMEWLNDAIFDNESTAYNVGKKPLRKRKLTDFSNPEGIISQFKEILRHNNVSDKENAFNRLIALFICKLVDETEKGDDDIVDFQYIQGSDEYETLQDRLQELHQRGMKKFMEEKIFYVPRNYASDLFSRYNGEDRSEAIGELNETIWKLKFYTNNDFAFKDVHNEELFYQNGKILVEMVQLFQPYKIILSEKKQLLGTLFEGLLNEGFKQNQGQFFTPIPITRFIWDSLPLKEYIERIKEIPKVIDYACGAAHFLIEAVEAINSIVDNKDNKWAKDYIYGIEKDYRLARTSKISMFMNGAGYANIIFGDGLENYDKKGIEPNSFDILVANPPFSVEAFKSHLKLKDNKFTLMGDITDKSGNIEVLFVERIAQLLKSNGIAAVILPSTILSKNDDGYAGARKILFENFNIFAIVELGGKTFLATSTSTVILFLEKRCLEPNETNILKDSSELIMKGKISNDYADKEILDAYIIHQNINEEDYIKFLKKEYEIDSLKNHSYFRIYVDEFLNDEKKKKNKYSSKLTAEQKEKVRKEKFYKYVSEIEQEKLYIFSLIYEQKTLVISAPQDTEEQKDFLGYECSRGIKKEGIYILNEGGKLYDPNNRFSDETLSGAIRNSFLDLDINLPEELQSFLKISMLKDMVNFSTVNFFKEIRTKARLVVRSKYNVVQLKDFAKDIKKGTSITKDDTIEGEYKVVAGGRNYAYTHNTFNREPNVITVSASGTAGFVNIWKERIFASDCITIYGKDDIQTSYIYYYMKSIQDYIYTLKTGSNQPHVYAKDLEEIQIPNPPNDVIKNIVSGCDKIDEKKNKLIELIEENKQKIQKIFSEIETITSKKPIKISDICDVKGGKRVPKGVKLLRQPTEHPYLRVTDFVNNSISKKNLRYISDEIFNRISRYTISKDDVYISIAGTIGQVGIIPEELDGANLTENAAKLVIRNKKDVDKKYLVCALKSRSAIEQIEISTQSMTIPKLALERINEISIPLPTIKVQKDVVKRVSALEQKVYESMEEIEQLDALKKEVLDKFLL